MLVYFSLNKQYRHGCGGVGHNQQQPSSLPLFDNSTDPIHLPNWHGGPELSSFFL